MTIIGVVKKKKEEENASQKSPVKFQRIHSVPAMKERIRATHLQAWKKCLKGVDPGVHDLSVKHVHIYIKRRVTFSFVASLSPV